MKRTAATAPFLTRVALATRDDFAVPAIHRGNWRLGGGGAIFTFGKL